MENTIDISGLDKAEVLQALYNASKQQGMGFMHARGTRGMTKEEAAEEIKTVEKTGNPRIYFDYLHGRVMKSEISGDNYDPWLYDRDNGQGAALRALEPLLQK